MGKNIQHKFYLVVDASEQTQRFLNSVDGPCIGLNYAVYAALDGISARLINPTEVLDESTVSEQQSSTLATWAIVCNHLEASGLTPTEDSLIRLTSLKVIQFHNKVRMLEAKLGAEAILVVEGSTRPYRATEMLPWLRIGKVDVSIGKDCEALPILFPSMLPKGCVFDLRVAAIRVIGRPGEPHALKVRQSGKPLRSWSRVLQNAHRILRSRLKGKRAHEIVMPRLGVSKDRADAIAAVAKIPGLDDPDLAQGLERLIDKSLLEMGGYEVGLSQMFRQHRRSVIRVEMDCVTDAWEAAVVQSARRTGIPVRMQNHGSLVVHGSAKRRQFAAAIAENGFNSHPDIDWFAPRSPHHAPLGRSGIEIERNGRTRPFPPDMRDSIDRPFRILLAPNFLIWRDAWPGLAPSCFECFSVVDAFARTLANDNRFELAIRIKTTTDDLSSRLSTSGIGRGVIPSHVDHLYGLGSNIIDKSYGSYSDAIDEADLVVTEGITKVIYEVIERRRPVLLANLSAYREPASPAAKLEDLVNGDRRFPLYQTGCDSDLTELLLHLRDRHQGRPLTDEELEGSVWP
ncbi:MAG: hypothetical protein AAF666_06495 [Pseudomonadota bacterium]